MLPSKSEHCNLNVGAGIIHVQGDSLHCQRTNHVPVFRIRLAEELARTALVVGILESRTDGAA